LAIIGFPFCGKTTVLQTACGLSADHVHTTGKLGEHIGTFRFSADHRLQWLTALHKPKKSTPMALQMWDFPGFDLTSEISRQHARRLWGQVRQCDLLVVVLRAFEDPSVPTYRDRIDPGADLAELMDEFVFADMDLLTRRAEKLNQQITKPTSDRDRDGKELDLVQRCLSALESNEGLDDVVRTADEAKMISSFALLTRRPCVVIINVQEDGLSKTFDLPAYPAVKSTLVCAAEYERQLQELSEQDRQGFLSDAGIMAMLADRLVKAVLDAMGMIVFYTVNEAEARAWNVPAGTSAVEAAGKIHSDMARGFIRAETIACGTLQTCGSYKQARVEGKLRLEGKHYIIQNGDVIVFRFNV